MILHFLRNSIEHRDNAVMEVRVTESSMSQRFRNSEVLQDYRMSSLSCDREYYGSNN